MTSPVTSMVRCDDGTEITVDWVYPGAQEYEWILGRDHSPQPVTPMGLALQGNYRSGADRAWEEAGIEPLPMFYRNQFAGPFRYGRMTPYAPARMTEINARYRELAKRHGNVLGFWLQYCEPRIRQACGELAAAAVDAPLPSLCEVWGYGHHQTFTSAAMLREAMARLTALLV